MITYPVVLVKRQMRGHFLPKDVVQQYVWGCKPPYFIYRPLPVEVTVSSYQPDTIPEDFEERPHETYTFRGVNVYGEWIYERV